MADTARAPMSESTEAKLKKERNKRKKRDRKQKKKSKKEDKVGEDLRNGRSESVSQSYTPSVKEESQDKKLNSAKRKLSLDSEDDQSARSKIQKIQSPVDNASSDATKEFIPRHPFEVDEADHCETPWRAYQDILPVLSEIAKGLGKSLKELKIYDPYYCDGGVKRKLNSLGCHKVINANRDFYQDISSGMVPAHDVIVTNPPYSGHHMESFLKFVSGNHVKTGKKRKKQQAPSLTPFLLLLPHYVYTKPYFLDYFESDARGIVNNADGSSSKNLQKLFYLVPKNNYRYAYEPPSWVSPEMGSTALAKGKTQTAPFPSFWYCHVPSLMESSSSPSGSQGDSWLTRTFGQSGHYIAPAKNNTSKGESGTLHYASRSSHLPREFKGEFDLTNNKRPNPRARRRAAKKKKQQRQEPLSAGSEQATTTNTTSTRGAKRKKKRF